MNRESGSWQNELFLKGKIKDIPHAFYKREARRLFGEAKFDCAIDLTGKKSLFSVVAKEMDGVRFFQYNARFVREKQIAKELDAQTGIVMRIMGADKEKSHPS